MDRVSKYIFDIQFAISLINSFLQDIDTFEAYQGDAKTQSAVERQLAIIGEAVNKLRQENTNLTIARAEQVIAFRNRIVHSYDTIDNAIVWAIIKNHLPALKQEIDSLATPL